MPHLFKGLYLGCFRGDLDNIIQRHLKWWKFRRVVFYLVDPALQRCFKPHLYQIGKSWFCVQVCGTNSRQHCDFTDKWSVKTSSVCCIEQILQFKVCQQYIIAVNKRLIPFYKSALLEFLASINLWCRNNKLAIHIQGSQKPWFWLINPSVDH